MDFYKQSSYTNFLIDSYKWNSIAYIFVQYNQMIILSTINHNNSNTINHNNL